MAVTTHEMSVGESTEVRTLPATLVRGGTSKCWVFHAADLPADSVERDRLLVRTFGSPDARQIDGIGGGSSTTSKAIIVEGLDAEGAVRYFFAQIAIDNASVETASNCGNCATALGLYALHTGMVAPTGDLTRVPVLNTTTNLKLFCEIPTKGGRIPLYGERRLDGHVYPGVPVDVVFSKDSWSSGQAELPTGHPVDEVELEGRRYPATLIDAGAPAALFAAAAFGFSGTEAASELDMLTRLAPQLRAQAASLMKLPAGLTSVPKVGIVGPPPAGADGVSARMISMGGLHPAIGLTSGVAIAAASGIPGSVVDQVLIRSPGAPTQLPLHLLNSTTTLLLDAPAPTEVTFQRTARVISEGTVLVPSD